MGDGRTMGELDLGFISLTVGAQVEVVDDVTKEEKVEDEEERSEDRALGDPLLDWRGGG